MSIFANFNGQQNYGEDLDLNSKEPEHAVIVYFEYGIDSLDPLIELGEKLDKIVTDKKVGRFDGNEIAMDDSDGSIYLYGPNAEALFKAIKPTLEETDFMKGATAYLRFGPAGQDVPYIELIIGK